MSLLELYCHVDDFWQMFATTWETELVQSGLKQRRRAGNRYPSEIMTILIHFHTYGELRYQMRFRDFKTYYTPYVQVHLQAKFPHLVSYNRFVELMRRYSYPCAPICEAAMGSVPA